MVNINWTREIDGTIYQMEFVEIRDKNYLVKFSMIPLDTVLGKDDTSLTRMVELSSSDIVLCKAHPKEAYAFINFSAEGFTCYEVDFCHDRSTDPEYECITRVIHPIHSMEEYIKRLREKPIEHDMNGCVVNTQSCVVRNCYFTKDEKAVYDFAENIRDDIINAIRLWEAENCYV